MNLLHFTLVATRRKRRIRHPPCESEASRTQFSCEGHAAVQPPSTTTTWPVQYVDVGAQRKSNAASSSARTPGRLVGHIRRNHFIAASLSNTSVFISVGKNPGARQFTR